MDIVRGCNPTTGALDTSRYVKPLPVIGVYIAGASLVCLFLIALDAFKCFPLCKNRWFSCKWFNINSATLTLLSVATKLPVDLNTAMPGAHHQLTKLTGTVMLSVSMAFFLPSLGTMRVEEMLSNMAALTILVVTVLVNICIQMGTGVIFAFVPEHFIVMASMLFMLVVVFTTAISSIGIEAALKDSFKNVSDTCKSVLEKAARAPSSVEEIDEKVSLCKEAVMRRLFMKHTRYAGDARYAIVRSRNCNAVAVLSFLNALILVQAEVRAFMMMMTATTRRRRWTTAAGVHFCRGDSDYKWSVWAVLVSQTLFVIVATIPILVRWFQGIRFLHNPIKEMMYRSRYLVGIEFKRLKSSYKPTVNILKDLFGAGITNSGFLRKIGNLFLSLQLLMSWMSRLISRTSAVLPALFFCRWLLPHDQRQQQGGAGEPDTARNMVVHLDGEEVDFHDWIYTRHKDVVSKEMDEAQGKSSAPDNNFTSLKDILKSLSHDPPSLLDNMKMPVWRGFLKRIGKNGETSSCCQLLSVIMYTIYKWRELIPLPSPIDLLIPDQLEIETHGPLDIYIASLGIQQAWPLLSYIDLYGFGKSQKLALESSTRLLHAITGGSGQMTSTNEILDIENNVFLIERTAYDINWCCFDSKSCGVTFAQKLKEETLCAIISSLTQIFIAAFHAISPKDGETYENDIDEEEVRATMNALYLFEKLKDPLFPMLYACYQGGRLRLITNLYPWENHLQLTTIQQPFQLHEVFHRQPSKLLRTVCGCARVHHPKD